MSKEFKGQLARQALKVFKVMLAQQVQQELLALLDLKEFKARLARQDQLVT